MPERYRNLDLLHHDYRPVADRFLARCIEAGIMVMVIETWRSEEAHEEDVRNGRSWVNRSKHQNAVQTVTEQGLVSVPASLAIDIAPYEYYRLHGADKLEWNNEAPIWQQLGELGELLGLKWGGRWQVRDFAHFEAPWA